MDLRLRSLFSALTSLTILFFFTLLVACGSSSPSSSATGGTGSNTGSTGSSNTGSGGSGSGGAATTTAIAFVTDGADGSNQWGGSSFSGVKLDSNGAASASAAATNMNIAIGSLVIPSKNLLFVSTMPNEGNFFTSASAPGASTINGYSFDANGGSLKQISSTPTTSTRFIATDSKGTTLYASGNTAPPSQAGGGPDLVTLWGWSVNPTSGSLTPLPGSPYVTTYDNGVSEIAVSPDGAWLCASVVVGEASPAIACFQRNSDGTLNVKNSIQPISSLQGGEQIAFSADSKWVFAAGGIDDAIVEGSLTNPTSSQTSTPTGGLYTNGVAVDPSGKWIVASNGSKNLTVFSIGSDGKLTAGPLATTPGIPSQLAFSKSGTSLFVATDAGTAVYSFDPSSGALTAASGSPVSGGGGGPIAAW